MESMIFAFQVVPGEDSLLGYASTLEECRSNALQLRSELAVDTEVKCLAPSAVYQVKLRNLDCLSLVNVLNDRTSLCDAIILEKHHVGFVPAGEGV